jgi:hypothetical protein
MSAWRCSQASPSGPPIGTTGSPRCGRSAALTGEGNALVRWVWWA